MLRLGKSLLTIKEHLRRYFYTDFYAVQINSATFNSINTALRFSNPADHILPGVVWGKPEHLFSPAFWHFQAIQYAARETTVDVQLGKTLHEEVAACLLGGFGMPAALGLAAFARLRDKGLLTGPQCPQLLERVLNEPLQVDGTLRRYRFPRQKANYLARCLQQLEVFREPISDREFREELSKLPGVGRKTASWIVRNRRRSNDIAVIDIHIHRAGTYIGLFESGATPQKHYLKMETQFVAFADSLGVQTWLLDAVMWDVMRSIGSLIPSEPYTKHFTYH
jgi:thermostable 8-oxoguanine DNA glycosylase